MKYLVYNFYDNNLKAKLERFDTSEANDNRKIINKYELNNIITNFSRRYSD